MTCKLCGKELHLNSAHIITITTKSNEKIIWYECDPCRQKKLTGFMTPSLKVKA